MFYVRLQLNLYCVNLFLPTVRWERPPPNNRKCRHRYTRVTYCATSKLAGYLLAATIGRRFSIQKGVRLGSDSSCTDETRGIELPCI
eukprot:scaffold200658_cov17-Prasinocladus_malaysianus.AAC.1